MKAPIRRVTLYRDDSTSQVVYERVKHVFLTADNTVLTLAVWDDVDTGAHHYVHWPRERLAWWKEEPVQ